MKASELIAIANEELGYIGKKNKTDNTDIKEAPNGVGKFNKYSRMLAPENYYNSPKDGADWCCIFVDAVAYMAAGNDKAKATACKPLHKGYCGAGVKYAHDAYGTAVGPEPREGAQVFYKDNDGLCHTGLVVKVNAETFETIEGNWNNRVSHRVLTKDDKSVADFGYPTYDPEPEPVPVPTDTVSVPREEYNRMIGQLAEYSVRAEKAEEAQKLAEIELANVKNALKNLI